MVRAIRNPNRAVTIELGTYKAILTFVTDQKKVLRQVIVALFTMAMLNILMMKPFMNIL